MLSPQAKQWLCVALCGLALLFAIIGMATRGWVSVTYPLDQHTKLNIGLQMGLPVVYMNGVMWFTNATANSTVPMMSQVDSFNTSEFARVGTMALGFGLLGLFLVTGGLVISSCQARGKVYSETYFGTLASCLMAALAFFFGSILYGLSVPTIGPDQSLGFSLGLYILAGCFSTFAGCLAF